MQLLFSVTKKDFDRQTFASSGPGGQHKNATKNCVRLVHRDSGAVGQGVVHREQYRNEREALRNLVETREFRNWHRMETARRLGKRREETQEEILARVDKMIESGLRDGSIVVEEIINGNEE